MFVSGQVKKNRREYGVSKQVNKYKLGLTQKLVQHVRRFLSPAGKLLYRLQTIHLQYLANWL